MECECMVHGGSTSERPGGNVCCVSLSAGWREDGLMSVICALCKEKAVRGRSGRGGLVNGVAMRGIWEVRYWCFGSEKRSGAGPVKRWSAGTCHQKP